MLPDLPFIPEDLIAWAVYVGGVWVCAYVFRVTAPVRCPKGNDSGYCREHHPLHMTRQSAGWDTALGLIWPIWLGVLAVILFNKSVSGAAKVTPMPTPKMTKVDLNKAIEAGDKELEAFAEENEERLTEIMNRKHQERQVHEATVIFDDDEGRQL